MARISSFGYNASFLPGSPRSLYNISDFAKELLYEMKFGKDMFGEDLNIGVAPIVFVAHSLGGLVVKKAYLLGQNDEAYRGIVESASAMIFLATPHRGTNLAEILNRILSILFQPSRDFIADLNKSSPALEEINEQFRHIAPRLSIWSFYETLATPVGPIGLKEVMVLDKDSSILGYTNEISRPLDADHHGVSKFSDPTDSNYVSVRNALSSLMRSRPRLDRGSSTQTIDESQDLEKVLVFSYTAEDDLNLVRSHWIPGTCEWLLYEPSISSWLEYKYENHLTWFCAPPASGKSTLCAHVINHLQESGLTCQYFFFKFDDPNKRSLNTFLKSIAYQAARDIPAFKRRLIEFISQDFQIGKANYKILWKRIFESILFDMDPSVPIYWVIDGLDESENPKAVAELLQGITSSQIPVRLLIFSRKIETLSIAFGRLAKSIPYEIIEKDASAGFNSKDIHALVVEEISHLRGSDELRQGVAESVESRAQGNFLWTRLVLQDIATCHSEDAIQEALKEIPSDMQSLYQRMEQAILNSPRKSNTTLAKAMLQWVLCAARPLSLQELTQALRPEFSEILDLKRTIQEVCSHFLVVNHDNQVTFIHETASDFLAKDTSEQNLVNVIEGHERLFLRSTSVLFNSNLRFRLTHNQHSLRDTEPFLFYATTSWIYHLKHLSAESDDALNKLIKLFMTESILVWIHAIAILGKLEMLVKSARVLSTFINKRRRLNLSRNPLLHRLSDLDRLERWTVDLLKLVGKFGKQLLSYPPAIYMLVAPFCPRNSIMSQSFYQPDSAEIVVNGISNDTWSDNLAKIALPQNDQAWSVACIAQNLAVLGSSGTTYVWNSDNFVLTSVLRHEEAVTAICMNKKADRVVTYGIRNTKVWSIPSGQLLSQTPNPADSKAMSLKFTDNSRKLLAASDDRVIRCLDLKDLGSGWQILNSSLLKETSQVEGAFLNSPICMAFNEDGSQIGVSYRGFPLSVWAVHEARCIGRCKRAKAFRKDEHRPSTSWFGVDRFTWNPVSGHIIGLYKDGCVFKWHPFNGENQEAQSTADEVAASSDGKLFLTSNSDGTIRIWNFGYFTVIYQLFSADLVTGLAFSPDCRRFYDLRGSSVNAWEPNSLLRFLDAEESLSDVVSEDQSQASVSHISEASLAQYEAATALTAAPDGRYYLCGNEEGTFDVFDAQIHCPVEQASFSNFLSVGHLVWAEDSRHIAAADLGGDVLVRRLDVSTIDGTLKTEMKSLKSPQVMLDDHGIQQMLFNADATLLLIVSDDRGQIWSLSKEAVVATAFDDFSNRKLLSHPTTHSLFLAFGATDVQVFRWQDFSEQPSFHFQHHAPQQNAQTKLKTSRTTSSGSDYVVQGSTSLITKAHVTQDRRHVLVQLVQKRGVGCKELLIFDSSSFTLAIDQDAPHSPRMKRPLPEVQPPPLPIPRSLYYTALPATISSRIEVVLGVIPRNRLAFLDSDLWFCTYHLDQDQSRNRRQDQALDDEDDHSENVHLKRHFFVPRDWVSTETLDQCCLCPPLSETRTAGTGVGSTVTLLCPRQDRVAAMTVDLEGLEGLGF